MAKTVNCYIVNVYASLSFLVTMHILVHHATHCSYSLGPQLFNIAHKNWVVYYATQKLKKLAIGFKELLATCNPGIGTLSLSLH